MYVPIVVPQPEAAIEPADCRLRLLQHVEKSQLLLEARLDSIEAQIAGKLLIKIVYNVYRIISVVSKVKK